MILGAALGGYYGGLPGGIMGGLAGGMIGSMFDPAGAGELNYHEKEWGEHLRKMKEYEDLLEEVQNERKELEPMLKKLNIPITPIQCP
jgi:hypothetical protein